MPALDVGLQHRLELVAVLGERFALHDVGLRHQRVAVVVEQERDGVDALGLEQVRLVGDEREPAVDLAWRPAAAGRTAPATLLTFDGSMLLALRNAFHTASLVACTPIFLPIMSCGVLMGLVARLMIANGFFWYCAPMITRSAPLLIADAVMSGAEMPTNALPDCDRPRPAARSGRPRCRLTLDEALCL